MTTPMKANSVAASVETTDELAKAIAAAHARADKIFAKGIKTLADEISPEALKTWDASDEIAVVADPDGLESDEDEPCLDAAA